MKHSKKFHIDFSNLYIVVQYVSSLQEWKNENVLTTIVYVFVASNLKISSFLHQFILMFTIKSGIFMSTTFSYYSLSFIVVNAYQTETQKYLGKSESCVG